MSQDLQDLDIYEALGEEGFTSMVAAFYKRVRMDDIISPMYPDDDWEGAEKRLRDFLIFRFGGSDRYIKERGHPRLRMRHAPYPITTVAAERWVKLMDESMTEVALPNPIQNHLHAFFHHVALFMRNR